MSKFIEKKSEIIYFLYLSVKPNSKKQNVDFDEEKLIISLRSKPIQNKANKELMSILKKKLGLSSTHI